MQVARPPRRSPYDVIAIAASAGGVPALSELLSELPADFPAAVLVVLHRTESTNRMPSLLHRRVALPVKLAEENERALPGTIYIAPGGRHLLVGAGGQLSVARSGRVGFVCPSADLLFESVALEYRQRALVLVLTGMGSDGAKGVESVRKRRGYVIVQDPESAAYPSMPHAAIETGKADLVLPLGEIPYALDVLTRLGAVKASEALSA